MFLIFKFVNELDCVFITKGMISASLMACPYDI